VNGEDQVQKLGGALGWGVVARLARMVLGLGGSVLVVRGLGAHDYGVLAVLRTSLAFVTIVVGGGLTQGLLRYLPAWRMVAGQKRIRRALIAFVVLQTVLWVSIVLFFWLLRPWVGTLSNETVAGLLLLGVALALPEVLGNTATQVANAYYDSRRVSAAVVVSTLTYVALVAWLIQRGAGVAGVLWASAGSNLVLAFWLARRVPAYLAETPVPPPADGGTGPSVRTVARYSVPFILIGILNLITWRQSEVLFLGHFRSAADAGFFDLAYRFPQMILEFVPGAIWPLVMAGFSEIYTRDPHALQRAGTAYYKLLFLLVAPLSVGGMLVGDLAIRFLYGSGFALSGTICQVFFFIFSVSFFATPLSMVLYVVERPWLGFGLYLINAAVNVGLDLLLIPRFGLWGAVLPVSLVILVSPLPYWWVLRRLGVAIRPPWHYLGRMYAASGAMLLLWPLRALVDSPLRLALLVLAGIVVWVVGMRLFRVLGSEEKSLIQRVNPRAWDRLAPLLGGETGERKP
jgi:O-antigen/teichoic acid export membrane protein